MKLHVTTANGKTHVADADTGKVLDWVQSVQIMIDPGGLPWLYLGTSAFDSTFAIQPNPPAAAAPMLAAPIAQEPVMLGGSPS